ncbi:FAD-dependent oxidoreductase [Salipiger sp. P9]|uniref:NAD(P)/FAD-dependent oxidoreductase n=1 Tax=Salipiger pentaromativorans TaxID=2943193 RepID=UPI0021580555|nr:FAD-dependent oxidoreductase [Salipiger pentaromativorans]MCR8548863.1 FAD-dependent oxidoreductase [Salipiger pentaromativorans]
MKNVVIVGGGQAGAAAALKLRELGYDGGIDLIGAESSPPYERPELSKGYLTGSTAFNGLVLLPPDKAAEAGIVFHPGVTATGIDRAARQVITARGTLPYDALILATGGEPLRLPLPPALAGRSFAIRSRADADALRARLDSARSVAVIGGGWLGTEVALTARSFGAEVALIEVAPRLCARVAPAWLSERLARIQQEAGVRLHIGARPEFSPDGTIRIGAAALVPDLVIEAIGMRANDALAEQAGLACADGVLVGPQGRTEDPAIFAIGDCAREAGGARLRRESWQNANHSAEDAVRLLLGHPLRRPEPDWFWSVQGKSRVQMLGTCPDQAEQLDRTGPRGGYSRLFLRGAQLIGCIAIDNPREIAEARRVLSGAMALDIARLSDPSLPLSRCQIDAREAIR